MEGGTVVDELAADRACVKLGAVRVVRLRDRVVRPVPTEGIADRRGATAAVLRTDEDAEVGMDADVATPPRDSR